MNVDGKIYRVTGNMILDSKMDTPGGGGGGYCYLNFFHLMA
jgi:hypothetical protein